MRRSVDRALVKRVLRDQARRQMPELRRTAAELGMDADVNLRVRVRLGPVGTGSLSVGEARRTVREAAAACIIDARARLVRKSRGLTCRPES